LLLDAAAAIIFDAFAISCHAAIDAIAFADAITPLFHAATPLLPFASDISLPISSCRHALRQRS
jgi:hypothetical protein